MYIKKDNIVIRTIRENSNQIKPFVPSKHLITRWTNILNEEIFNNIIMWREGCTSNLFSLQFVSNFQSKKLNLYIFIRAPWKRPLSSRIQLSARFLPKSWGFSQNHFKNDCKDCASRSGLASFCGSRLKFNIKILNLKMIKPREFQFKTHSLLKPHKCASIVADIWINYEK